MSERSERMPLSWERMAWRRHGAAQSGCRASVLGVAALCGVLVSCADITPVIPAPLQGPKTEASAASLPPADASERGLAVTKGPTAPAAKQLPAPPPAPAPPAPGGDELLAAVNLQQVALPTFIQILYAEVLKKPVNLHPDVVARKDLVTFRTGGGQTAAQLEEAAKLLLKSYGLSAIDVGGLVRVVPDNAALGALPSIRYGAAASDTPQPLRPVFHLVQLQAVRQTDVTNWLRTMFGDRIKVQEDAGRNAVLLSGNPDNMKAALEAISVLDQPAMTGRTSIAMSPAYWSADELAKRLAEVLSAEGYAVHPVGQQIVPGASRYPVILLPVAALNSVYVFAQNDTLLAHIEAWGKKLDRPNDRGIGKNFFSYAVRHKDAELLAQTLEKVLSGSRAGPAPAAAAAGAPQGSTASRLTSVVIDKSTNTLIFQVNADDYGQIISLLQVLDRPSKAALIEVTVAELSLNDSAQLGVEWLASMVDSQGRTYEGGTLGTLGIGLTGFNFRIFNGAGQLRVALNALASDNRATILSSPRVMARNGETATIQVGEEVPIITSQQSTGTVAGPSGTGLLQTVQYRNTGVILKVKPVIHAGDQVDLDVSQEVSAATATTTGVSSSPTFTTRKVDTKLTLKAGSTVLLGGLISDSASRGKSGIPFLKDIPGVGALFSNQTGSGNRRELIVLITPYVINDSQDAEAITESFRKSLRSWAGMTTPPPGTNRDVPAEAVSTPVNPPAPADKAPQ